MVQAVQRRSIPAGVGFPGRANRAGLAKFHQAIGRVAAEAGSAPVARIAALTLDPIDCHSGAPQRRQVYAACVNLAACGEPGIHIPDPWLWIPGALATLEPRNDAATGAIPLNSTTAC